MTAFTATKPRRYVYADKAVMPHWLKNQAGKPKQPPMKADPVASKQAAQLLAPLLHTDPLREILMNLAKLPLGSHSQAKNASSTASPATEMPKMAAHVNTITPPEPVSTGSTHAENDGSDGREKLAQKVQDIGMRRVMAKVAVAKMFNLPVNRPIPAVTVAAPKIKAASSPLQPACSVHPALLKLAALMAPQAPTIGTQPPPNPQVPGLAPAPNPQPAQAAMANLMQPAPQMPPQRPLGLDGANGAAGGVGAPNAAVPGLTGGDAANPIAMHGPLGAPGVVDGNHAAGIPKQGSDVLSWLMKRAAIPQPAPQTAGARADHTLSANQNRKTLLRKVTGKTPEL